MLSLLALGWACETSQNVSSAGGLSAQVLVLPYFGPFVTPSGH